MEAKASSNTINKTMESADTTRNKTDSPAIELPKGGGAMRGISENFAANPVTGTSSFTIPLPVSSVRGFEPQITLSYDSGGGNGVFGLGWSLSLPSIVRKTDKRLPSYEDDTDSDTYTLSGFEDLVPFLEQEGSSWQEKVSFITLSNGIDDIRWEVKRYRPRTEGAFSKIERWRDRSSNRIWWRTVSSTNVNTVYGYHDQACIFKPGNRAKTFRWLADFSYDDKGHLTRYIYQKDDDRNIDFSTAHEFHRKGKPHSQVYLKKVLYGIKASRIKQAIDDEMLFSSELGDRDFLFQTVFDYGDHSGDKPGPEPGTAWPVRHDAFSTYRSGFEIRTYRRCQRVLLFHNFSELGDQPELIRALKFNYKTDVEGFSFLNSAMTIGYKRDSNGFMEFDDAMPPMEFEYQAHLWNAQLQSVAPESLESLPEGVDNQRYQWVDLYGEGLSGVVSEHSGALYYRQNDGGAQLSPARMLASSPSLKGFGSLWQFQDLEGNGIKSLVSTNGITRGYYQFSGEIEWEDFVSFPQVPHIDFNDPNLRIIDLNGDGRPDILISEERAFRWYPSKGKEGYDQANISLKPGEAGRPEIIFSNDAESIFIADMTGDGLSDIVRIRNGHIVYWPNLGYGRFGARVTMSGGPTFNHPDQFTASHIRLADLDGSGTTDVVYLGTNEFTYWINNSGNSWSQAYETLNPFPEINNLNAISVIDLLGTGTACVVWSSPLPAHRGQHIRYIDLMGSVKPHLMKAYHNGFGKTVKLEYTPSTHFYLEDKKKGQPWVTRLHFPVHCLSKTEHIDQITGARFVSTYRYHHGYYDHAEREFRGFGRVDQINSETYDHFVKGQSSNVVEKVLHQTPILTKTWFHTGVYLDRERILNQYEKEYCTYDNPEYAHLSAFELSQPELPEGLLPAEWREALRACKGMALRTETYGLDGTEKEKFPFSIATATCAIRKIQPKSGHQYAVFQTLNTESIHITLDRNPHDPRISQTLQLAHDAYGNPLSRAAINYGRRFDGPGVIQSEQQRTKCEVSQASYTDDDYGLLGNHDFQTLGAPLRMPVTWKNSTFELGLEWHWGQAKFSVEDVAATFTSATPIDYLRSDSTGIVSRARPNEKRLLSSSEIRFANDALDGERAAAKPGPLGIAWRSYQLAFTPALLSTVYGDKVDPASSEGGYVDLHGDGRWWVPSGTAMFKDPQEIEQISERFYIPFGSQDAFGAASWNQLDPYLLLPTSSSVSKAGFDVNAPAEAWQLNRTIAINDYRTLSPKFLRDVNDNWRGVETDAYGWVVKTAFMGKVPGTDENTPPDDDAVTEGDNLANPSATLEYGFYDKATNRPAWVKTRSYTQHYADAGMPRSTISDPLQFLDQYEYSDGSGNVVMVKAQAEPGIAKQLQPDGTVVEVDTRAFDPPQVRWVGNGRTIINNAGNPVKQYEPYFSVTHAFETASELVEIGITPILFYDAAGRNVCKLNPNKTYEKVVLDAWHQQSWDVNDNLFLVGEDGSRLTDYTADPDVGHFFSALESVEYSPSWYAERINGDEGAEQQRAAQKTEPHVATPAESHADALGRAIYAVAHNRVEDSDHPGEYVDEKYATRTHLDIEGNLLSVVDARGNVVMQYRYSMLPPPDKENPKPALYQNSMDGSEKWTLLDVQGKVIKSWDSRGHVFETYYDELNRPTESTVLEDSVEKTIALSFYHDSDGANADAVRANNLIGAAYEAYDQAGLVEYLMQDFKGNPLRSRRAFAVEFKQTVDWNPTDPRAQLQSDYFETTFEYDALNRVTHSLSPHNPDIPASETWLDYNESGALDSVDVKIRSGEKQHYVVNMDYDAKGQRQHIEYGNGVTTTYDYEDDTYRLLRLFTSLNANKRLQDLNYVYDPVGNITEITDNAQQDIFFCNQHVMPQSNYLYDSLYRLIVATGRENAVQAAVPDPHAGWTPVQACGNDEELRNYTQKYCYDAVGNIEQMAHRAGGNGWTRYYQYAEENNRLLATTLSDPDLPFNEPYEYNAHGSMTRMPHLPVMQWTFLDQLQASSKQVVNNGTPETTYYVYDAGGQRTRKLTESNGTTVKERIYLGGWEIYREIVAGQLRLERETLHVMDDQKRIALIETKTVSDGAQVTSPIPVVRYQLGNHLGSASLELSDDGNVTSYEEYHPYGTTAYHAGTSVVEESPKRYRYTGKERDEESGFSYHAARYLVEWLGRWTAMDPIGIGDGPNVYIYAQDNPSTNIDVNGKQSFNAGEPLAELQDKAGNTFVAFRAKKDTWISAAAKSMGLDQKYSKELGYGAYVEGIVYNEKGQIFEDPDKLEVGEIFYIKIRSAEPPIPTRTSKQPIEKEGWFKFIIRNTIDAVFFDKFEIAIHGGLGGEAVQATFGEEGAAEVGLAANLITNPNSEDFLKIGVNFFTQGSVGGKIGPGLTPTAVTPEAIGGVSLTWGEYLGPSTAGGLASLEGWEGGIYGGGEVKAGIGLDGAIVASGSMPTYDGMWVSGGLDIQGEGSGTAALTGDGGVSVRYTGESLGELDLMPEFLRAYHSSYTDWLKRGR